MASPTSKNYNVIGNSAMAESKRKPISRNKKIMTEKDMKFAKSGQVISNPLMCTGLSSLRNIQNKRTGIDDIPLESTLGQGNVQGLPIRQPWISAQKREINMVSPTSRANDSKVFHESSYILQD